MKTGNAVGAIVMVLATVFVGSLLSIKLLWAWTIPDLFPRGVADGYVAADISWFTAMKIAFFVLILSAYTPGRVRDQIEQKKGALKEAEKHEA